jgi:DNA mismatch repair ATPase MutS
LPSLYNVFECSKVDQPEEPFISDLMKHYLSLIQKFVYLYDGLYQMIVDTLDVDSADSDKQYFLKESCHPALSSIYKSKDSIKAKLTKHASTIESELKLASVKINYRKSVGFYAEVGQKLADQKAILQKKHKFTVLECKKLLFLRT